MPQCWAGGASGDQPGWRAPGRRWQCSLWAPDLPPPPPAACVWSSKLEPPPLFSVRPQGVLGRYRGRLGDRPAGLLLLRLLVDAAVGRGALAVDVEVVAVLLIVGLVL